MRTTLPFILLLLLCACKNNEVSSVVEEQKEGLKTTATSLIILGTIQDAGSPHIACKKDCCKELFKNPDAKRQVVSLGLYDASQDKRYLFEATPDITTQVKALSTYGDKNASELPDGIFITHAHIGHYSGLMYLGKEATNASKIDVFAMPRMGNYLATNGPWSQLVANNNIIINSMKADDPIQLSEEIIVTPFLVPHRDEYSETVGYTIKGPHKTALFIPDIDKWEKWEKSIIAEVKKVDYAFLDATFFDAKEINNRDISEIPHPFIIESMNTFSSLSKEEKKKIIFIHFNHTNPVIDTNSTEALQVIEAGYTIARMNDSYDL